LQYHYRSTDKVFNYLSERVYRRKNISGQLSNGRETPYCGLLCYYYHRLINILSSGFCRTIEYY